MTPTQRHYFELAIMNAINTFCDNFHHEHGRWPTKGEQDAFETETRKIWA